MKVASFDTRNKALTFSLVAVGSIMAFEGIAGFMTNSLALLSDATHGAYDVLVTLLLLFSTRIALKPPDKNHPYGHMKFESLGTLVAALMMLGLALMIAVAAISRVFLNGVVIMEVGVGFLALGYALVVHTARVVALGVTLRRAGGMTVKADLVHASSDLFSTAVAALGFYLAAYGLHEADAFAGLALAATLGFMSVRLSKQAVAELSDAVPEGLREEVVKVVESVEGVVECGSLRMRKAGDEFFVEMEIAVPRYFSLEEAHEVASKVEEKVRERLGRAKVTVHFEPR